MKKLRATNGVNYQERARQFSPGDVVVPFGLWGAQAGRVTAVFPPIGMADVELANGNKRFPVEELQLLDGDGNAVPPFTNSTPGGRVMEASASKVALYWAAKNRRYKMDKREALASKPCCPRCKDGIPLSKANYKRRDGASEGLLGCKSCLFLIKPSDIVNHPAFIGEAFDGLS